MKESILSVALVFPELLGTYGDRGNAAALVHRARGRGLDCRVLEVGLHDPFPRAADIYLLGGGEELVAPCLVEEELERVHGGPGDDLLSCQFLCLPFRRLLLWPRGASRPL